MSKPERIVGRIPVLECLRVRKRRPRRLYCQAQARGLERLLDAAEDVPVETRSAAELDQLAGGVVHQGVVLDADPLPLYRPEDWSQGSLPADAVVVLLDGVEDPHNFGAIVRSAAAWGALAVVFGKDRAAPISPASLKSAAGAMEHIDLLQATNLVRGIDAFKKVGFWVSALEDSAPQDIWAADLRGRVVLVVGSEGEGIRRLVREHCDSHLRIPLPGPIKTLNASVSAAIALAECTRQRKREV